MAGICLTMDEIKTAPPEVRRWLEREVQRALGIQAAPAPVTAPQLIGCNVEEVRDMLALVQSMLSVVTVLFELGRETAGVAVHGMRAFRIVDIQHHARMQSAEQVIQCLDLLTEALRRVRGDMAAAFYAIDDAGHCLIAEATMHSIVRLWQSIVAERALREQATADSQPPMTAA